MTALADRIAALTPEQRELLLRRVATSNGAAHAPEADTIPRRPDAGPIAETAGAQEELWLLDRLDPGNPSSNIGYPVRLRGPLDAAALGRAVAEVVRRHEALRTSFPVIDGVPVQRISSDPFAGIETHDLGALAADEREAEARRRVLAEMRHRFNLEAGPLLRVTLLRLAPDEHVMVVLMHHIVGDGWSLDVFFRELEALYGAFSRGLPSPLPELPLQFADWAAWQSGRLAAGGMEAERAYWLRTLAGAPPVLALPCDHPRADAALHRAGWHGFPLPPATAQGLRALARAEGATPFGALLAVFAALLRRWTDQDDLVIGTAAANRARVETEGLIGYFINTLVLRTRLHGDPSFREAVRRARDAVSGAFAHEELPFERMVEALRPEVRPGVPPVFQVQCLYQNATRLLRLPGLDAELLPPDRTATEFDLTLNVSERDDGSLACGFEYSAELFEPGTMERLGEMMIHLAASAVASPDAPLSALPLPDGIPASLERRGRSIPIAGPAPSVDEAPAPGREWQLLLLSARTRQALDAATAELAAHLRANPGDTPSIARELALGRRAFAHRRAVLVRRGEDAAAVLNRRDAARATEGIAEWSAAPVAFLFAGTGDGGMETGRGLYAAEPVFRDEVDRCAGLLRPALGVDLRELLDAEDARADAAAEAWAFVHGWALARLWASWGIVPDAVLGHGPGEVTAACVAGVLALDDALALVAARAQAVAALPAGSRLEVALSADAVGPFLVPGAELAEANGPSACVVAGRNGPVAEVGRRLRDAGHDGRLRPAAFPLGSPLLKVATYQLLQATARMRLSPPAIPIVSTVTGAWLGGGEATDPAYWARHLRQMVRFDAALAELARDPGRILLEIGPGATLRDLAAGRAPIVTSLAEGDAALPEPARLLAALARLWTQGASPDWRALWPGERRLPIRLDLSSGLAPADEPPRPDASVSSGIISSPDVVRTPAPFRTDADPAAGDENRFTADAAWDARPAGDVAWDDASRASADPAGIATRPPPARDDPAGAMRDDPAEGAWDDPPATGGDGSGGTVQDRLAAIWAELLGVAPRPTDDFFLLGGHSLLATQLLARVLDTFGVELELRVVFQSRNLAALAGALESSLADAPEFLTDAEALSLV